MPIVRPAQDERRADGPGVAYLAIDLRTNTPVGRVRAEQLDRPIAPGSVIKIATLAAALESGVIGERTGITCTRDITVAGHHLTCTHPDFHRPLQPAEALAQSCNVFFAAVAGRLARPAFDHALSGLGLPLSDRQAPLALAALGIDGVRVAPRLLIDMLARVAEDPSRLPWRASTLAIVRDGLHAAARTGTAAALAARGIDALAKTGTTIASNGSAQGLVVGVTPASRPSVGFVALASGAAGLDAAALVADLLKPPLRPPPGPQSASGGNPQAATRNPQPATTDSTRTIRVGIAREGGGYAVRPLPIEEYVAGVVAGEAARDSSPSALEALAITVRTFAMANLGRHRGEGFDMCDLTHCQVLRKATSATTRAAEATSGRILLYRGAPASVFYTASCGGHTERPSAVWPGAEDPEFLPSRDDDACEGQPAWTAELSEGDLARALRSGGFRGGGIRGLRIVARNGSGRVTELRVDGFTPNQISGQDLRTIVGRTLGWQFIKSTAFDLRRTSAGFQFSGHGSGHGVGMCVIGAAHLGARGRPAAEILSRYFPGAQISARTAAIAAPAVAPALDVVVSLPAGDEGERDVIRDLAVRARDRLAKQLGVAVPPRIALRFHPTVESYQRASGQPWFTTGATVSTEMHFVPLTVLRDRGVLEKTVQHELVHLLTGPALAGRPLWVREGAASYFAGERTAGADPSPRSLSPGPRVTCPSDDELLRPVSPGALSVAYTRAAACFARQVASGKKWSEVK
jgi:stage II sporulation protein D (peptidoglycan lytic transglycosylase)